MQSLGTINWNTFGEVTHWVDAKGDKFIVQKGSKRPSRFCCTATANKMNERVYQLLEKLDEQIPATRTLSAKEIRGLHIICAQGNYYSDERIEQLADKILKRECSKLAQEPTTAGHAECEFLRKVSARIDIASRYLSRNVSTNPTPKSPLSSEIESRYPQPVLRPYHLFKTGRSRIHLSPDEYSRIQQNGV